MDDDRGTGKTTRLMEEAIGLLAEGHEVYVTGPHFSWLRRLKDDFADAGLVGVHFISMDAIVHKGALRGRRGRLLVDDWRDIPDKYRFVLLDEAFLLRTCDAAR